MPTPAELRADLRVFARAVGHDLTDWQARALQLRKRTTVIVANRQSGKTSSIALKAVHSAFARPDQHVLVISSGEDASRRLLSVCAEIAATPLLGPSVIDEMAAQLTLSNRSTIRSVPSSEAAVRGHSVDLLAVDEAAQVEPGLLLSAAIPTTAARPNARIILAGSPGEPSGPFYDAARRGERGAEDTETFSWTLTDCTWIEASVIDAAREQLPPAAFAREMEGVFADVLGDERLIERSWIERAQDNVLEPGPVVFGCDVARRGVDSSVVIEMRGAVARTIFSTLGHDTMKLAAKLAQISKGESGPTPTLAVDEISVGGGVVDRLVELGVPVTGYNASHRSPDPGRYANLRASSYWDLRELFRLGEIDLDPADRRLADELASLTYKLDQRGRIQLVDKAALPKSPDFADALCIAAWARGVHVRGEQIKALLDQQRRTIERGEGQREPSERLLGEESPRTTEERWSKPRERIVDSDLPTFW